MDKSDTQDESCELGGGLDDWYDAALKSGQGFKSEAERQAYIDSLGDPMKHPLFAQSTEDLVDNPYADALRALREEDKTAVELSIMYKDEGNEILKKGNAASFREAASKYSYALTFVDQADEARKRGDESESDSVVDLMHLRSQILSNRALTALNFKNYGSCYKDADLSLVAWPQNMKAHFRKCKALLLLKRLDDCLQACEEALRYENSSEVIKLRQQCLAEYGAVEKLRAAKQKASDELDICWGNVWDIVDAENHKSAPIQIVLGYATSDHPEQMKAALPSKDSDGDLRWPVLFLYPQYHQLDVLPDAGIDDMLAEHLAAMFPEFDDQVTPVGWDAYQEYQVSNLIAYVALNSSPPIRTRADWISSCRELRMLRGLDGSEAQVKASEALQQRQVQHTKSLVESTSSSSPSTGAKQPSSSVLSPCSSSPGLTLVELYLGLTFRQILQIPNHVATGGILTLLVFVRDNDAHSRFLRDAKSKDGSKLLYMGPTGLSSPAD